MGQSDSAEHHKLNEPFNVHGKVWEVASVSPDGRSISLRPSDAQVEMKAYLDPGYPAPKFTAQDWDGNPVVLAEEAAGAKYVLLDFWASWCGPCRAEYPYLRQLQARYKSHGLRIIGINLDTERDKAVQAAAENQLDYRHVFDGGGWENAVAVLYRVRGIPQTFLLDSKLNIVAKDLRGSGLEREMGELLGSGDTTAGEPSDKRERPFLGLRTSTLQRKVGEQPGKDTEHGVLVVEVIPESPAAKAGFHEKDVITHFSGRPVKLPSELPEIVGNLPVGSTHKVTIRRDGEPAELEVRLDELPESAATREEALRLVSDADRHRVANDSTRAVAAYKAAIDIWQQLTKEHPGDAACQRGLAEALYGLGLAYDAEPHQGRQVYEAVIPIYKRLVAEFPQSSSDRRWLGGAYCNLAHLLRKLQEHVAALEKYRLSIETLEPLASSEPEDSTARRFLRNAYWGRARTYGELGQHAEAITDYSSAITYMPDDHESFQGRATAYAQTGKWEQAAADFKRLVDRHANSHEAWGMYARASLGLGNTGEYRRVCQELLDRFSNSQQAGVAESIVRTCCLMPDAVSDWKPCVQLAERAGSAPPQRLGMHNTLGAILYRAGDFEAAQKQLQNSIDLHGGDGTWWDGFFMALTAHRLGRPEEARRWLEIVVKQIGENRQKNADKDVAPSQLTWETRLEQQLLRREAERLILPGLGEAP